jgi:sn-glycerol 3-phosphate transport system permease protein
VSAFERSRSFDTAAAILVIAGIVGALGPLYLAVVAASQAREALACHHIGLWPGRQLAPNLATAWRTAAFGRKLVNSMIVCALVTLLRLALATTSAFALVFFRTPLRTFGFVLIFLTLMLPLEARIAPTYGVASDIAAPLRVAAHLAGVRVESHWSLLDSYLGLSLPLAATATGTFLFIQAFRAIPDELVDAAKIDGAGPLRFLRDVALPMTRSSLGGLGVVTFLAAWNQYLWPLLITTRAEMQTAVLALTTLLPDPQDPAPAWNVTMAGAIITALPPILLVAALGRSLQQGLSEASRRS